MLLDVPVGICEVFRNPNTWHYDCKVVCMILFPTFPPSHAEQQEQYVLGHTLAPTET